MRGNSLFIFMHQRILLFTPVVTLLTVRFGVTRYVSFSVSDVYICTYHVIPLYGHEKKSRRSGMTTLVGGCIMYFCCFCNNFHDCGKRILYVLWRWFGVEYQWLMPRDVYWPMLLEILKISNLFYSLIGNIPEALFLFALIILRFP